MKRIEDECVGCSTPRTGLQCLGSSCPNREVVRFYCDRCGCEEKLYNYCGIELCADCILDEFEVVEGSDYHEW